MAAVLETIEKEKEVNYLSNVDVQFVSLVKHGAIRQPFRLIKSDEEDVMAKAIQTVMVAKPETIETLVEKEGLGWLSDADPKKKSEFDEYFAYEQQPIEDFEQDKLELVKVGPGVFVLAGPALKQKADGLNLPESPMGSTIATVQPPAVEISFGEGFYKELDSFISGVMGHMNQTQADGKARKKAVLALHKNFGDFLAMALDRLPNTQVKFDARKFHEKGDDSMSELTEARVQEMITESLKAGFEELKTTFKSEVEELLKANAPKEGEKPEGDAHPEDAKPEGDAENKAKADEDLKALVEGLGKAVQDLGGKLDKVKGDLGKIGNAPNAQTGTTDLEADKQKDDEGHPWEEFLGVGIPAGKERSKVFKNLLTRTPAQ